MPTLFAALQSAWAADRIVELRTPPALRADIAAMPKIVGTVDDAERRINAALRRVDATMRKTGPGCDGGDWERTVEAPMRGPGFLSLVITDVISCPARPPGISVLSIVYDLRSGAPVDWTKLLPARLTGKLALETGADGTRVITLASKALHELYLAGYRLGDADASCREVVADPPSAPPPMMAWLDAKAGGLAIQVNLPRAVQACSDPVVIPTATLRSSGATPRLIDAIEAAR